MSPVAIGIDIGGTGIKAAAVDLEAGDLAGERVRIPTPHPPTPEAVMETAAKTIAGLPVDAAVGVGFPGAFVDGEVIKGYTSGYSANRPGFFLIPAEADSNNARVFIVSNIAAYEQRYGLGHPVIGRYGGWLDDAGEAVKLVDATDEIILAFTYDDDGDWPPEADGLGPSLEVVIAGDPETPDTRKMLNAIQNVYAPRKVVLLRPSGAEAEIAALAPFVEDQTMVDGKATAYVCVNRACSLPTTDPQKMLDLVEENTKGKDQSQAGP